MVKLEDIDPTLDPIVQAAMLDDDEPETTEEVDEGAKSHQATAQDDTSSTDEEADETNQPEEGNEVVEDPSTEKEEVNDEDTDNVEEDEPKKLTRKEKREAKRQKYLEAIQKEGEQNSQRYRQELFQTDPNYKPLDYSQASEVEVDELTQDRVKYGQQNFSRGAEMAQRLAEQDNFWQGVQYEDKLLSLDPKYAFLNEKDPDNFDEDRAVELQELFLELVGFNPDTNTVRRTDLSWDKFVRNEVARIERWNSIEEDRIIQNAASQRATSGIRPSGASTKSLGKLKPGDISKMSHAEFEKYEAEIDRQILAELGN